MGWMPACRMTGEETVSGRIIFCGKRALAARCLEFLINLHRDSVEIMVANPDGFGDASDRSDAYRDVRRVADKNGLVKVRHDRIQETGCDFLISVLYSEIFSSAALRSARCAAFNLHPAPLPEYRGSHGRTHAILNGDTVYATTLHHMSVSTDQGDIILEKHFPILPGDTAESLDRRTMHYSFPAFCEAWLRILDGSAERTSQQDLIARGGRTARYFRRDSLDLAAKRARAARPIDLHKFFRAFYFPPTILPPPWVESMLRNSGIERADILRNADRNTPDFAGPS